MASSFILRSFVLPPFEDENKHQERKNDLKTKNIMFDTRICRGSTLKLEKIRSRLIKCDQKNKTKRFKKVKSVVD